MCIVLVTVDIPHVITYVVVCFSSLVRVAQCFTLLLLFAHFRQRRLELLDDVQYCLELLAIVNASSLQVLVDVFVAVQRSSMLLVTVR